MKLKSSLSKLLFIILMTFFIFILGAPSPTISVSAPIDAWPMFQHDIQRTGRSQQVGPKTNNVRWTFPLPDDLNATAAVASDGTIIFPIGGAGDSLYALNPNGSVKWSSPLIQGSATTPAIGPSGTIYLAAGGGTNGTFYAFNSDGTLYWTYKLPWGSSSSPAIGNDGTIYTVVEKSPQSQNSELHAINGDGTLQWVFTAVGNSRSSPALDQDGIIYFGAEGGVFAVNPDGSLKWKFVNPGIDCFHMASPAIGADGTIYIGSTCSGDFFAFSPDGNELWRYPTVMGWGFFSSPAIGSDGTIYTGNFGGGSGQGVLYAINPDGTGKWNFPADRIRSSPVIDANGTIYFSTDDGATAYAINSDGTKLWSRQIGCVQGGASAIGPDGTLYVGTSGCPAKILYAFGSPLSNTPPTADSNGPYVFAESSSNQLDGSGSSDPDQASSTLIYEWDLDYDGVNFNADTTGIQPQVSFPDNFSVRTIALRVTDSGGLSNVATTGLEVLNVAPIATFANTPVSIIEGDSVTLAFSSQFDPSVADTMAGFLYSYDCIGDGLFEASGVTTPSFDCLYPNAGTFTSRGRIADKDGGFTDYMTSITVLTPQAATGEVINDVEDLVDSGILNQGQGNALISKLESIIEKLNRGNTNAAINQLQAFINQVNDLINEGVLTPAEGQPLIDAASEIMAAVSA